MPELPEVEQIRRTLEPALLGASVVSAKLHRRDVFRRGKNQRGRVHDHELLAGSTITKLLRHGKNLAIVADTGRVLCVHLGMSGQLRWFHAGQPLMQTDHVHAVWNIRMHAQTGRLVFRDPRRFGGLWSFDSINSLRELRWNALGPDALAISGDVLLAQLGDSKRPIKSALLDQTVLAGVGNIYADEALFAARIHPATAARRIDPHRAHTLATCIVDVLSAAIASGGSTIRSYVDSTGQGGNFAQFHHVYGRGGQPCHDCNEVLKPITLAQRTTVFCPKCQPLRPVRPTTRRSRSADLSTHVPQPVRGLPTAAGPKSKLALERTGSPA